MRWREGRSSENVEDERGTGGGLGVPGGGMRIGLGGLLLVVVGAWLFGADPMTLLQLLGGGVTTQSPGAQPGAAPQPGGPQDEGAEFVSKVLASTEDTWGGIFQSSGARYAPPKLVLFSEVVRSACGMAQGASGPFYCPRDQKVYIDLDFYRQLRDEFHAPGDFAQAYVIAHEVGHHVQTLMGTSQQVRERQSQASEADANALSVALELQADCYAGVWANHANASTQLLEPGDLEDGLRAAASVGDDTIQKRSRGYVVPESFTHGSAQQRVSWFRRGFGTGDLGSCDTFGAGG
jgi:uncharacterized protein